MSRPERRSQPRFRLDRMMVRCGTLSARVVDASLDGLSLLLERPLSPGRSYPLWLGHGASRGRLLGRVVWCSVESIERRDGSESVTIYRAGLALRHPATRDRGDDRAQPPEPPRPSSPRSTSRCRA